MGFETSVLNVYNLFMDSLPQGTQDFIGLFLLVLLIVFYSIFIWKFYKWIATKNIIELNLKKYNTSENPVLTKMVAGGFYLLEYIILLPFLIFIWFSVFTIFLMLLTENLPIKALLIISATIIAAIRMTSYYKQDLANDLAKLLPFTLLAVSIVNPNFFDIERIVSQFAQIPSFFNQIVSYLIFIIVLEVVLRLFDFIFSIFSLHEEPLPPPPPEPN